MTSSGVRWDSRPWRAVNNRPYTLHSSAFNTVGAIINRTCSTHLQLRIGFRRIRTAASPFRDKRCSRSSLCFFAPGLLLHGDGGLPGQRARCLTAGSILGLYNEFRSSAVSSYRGISGTRSVPRRWKNLTRKIPHSRRKSGILRLRSFRLLTSAVTALPFLNFQTAPYTQTPLIFSTKST